MANRYDRDDRAEHWDRAEGQRDENPWERSFRGRTSRNWPPAERSAGAGWQAHGPYTGERGAYDPRYGSNQGYGEGQTGEERQYWQNRDQYAPGYSGRDYRSPSEFGGSSDYGRQYGGRPEYGGSNYERGYDSASYAGDSTAHEDERRFGRRVREFFSDSGNDRERYHPDRSASSSYPRPDYNQGHYGSGPSYGYYSGPTYGIGYESRSYGRVGNEPLGAQRPQGGTYSSHAGRGPKGYSRSDQRIREDVCDRLSMDDEVDASDITVTVRSGEVTLEGTVETRRMKHRAEDIAESVAGVSDVHNSVKVRKGLLTELADKVIGKGEEPQHHAGSGTKTSLGVSSTASTPATSSSTTANGRI